MLIAINKRTKEHRLLDQSRTLADQLPPCRAEWKQVETADDGWIPWEGGECPLPPESECDVKTYYSRATGCVAAGVAWESLVAYRPRLTKPEAPRCTYCDGTGDVHSPDGEWRGECTVCKPEAPEWEGGLPPVGMCEASQGGDNAFFKCEVIAHHYMTGRPIIKTARIGSALTHAPECWKFRPIRSEEERRTDEAVHVLDANPDDFANVRGVIQRMIAAGYRKTEGPNEDA